MNDKTSITGIIPQYPKHSQNNIFAKVQMPPVGIISCMSQINPEYPAYAIDENNYSGPLDFTGLPDHNFLQKRKPAQIAMLYGGMTNSIPRMFSLAQQYKQFNAITIAGGSHVDALPEEALRSGVDIVVHGEGEKTTKEIMQLIKERGEDFSKGLENIAGISFMNDNEIRSTEKRAPNNNLDELRSPDLTLIKYLKNKWTAIPINRGRGCNSKCEFCVVNEQYGPYKSGSTEKALEQIVKYSDMGYKTFFFADDNFAQKRDEAIDLCRKLGDYKKKFKKKLDILVQVRSETAKDDELIQAMRYAGVTTLCIGFESPIDEELKAMKKGVTVKKLTERSQKLSKYFYIHGMFIFGYPASENSRFRSDLPLNEKAKRYEKFFRQSKIDTVQVLNAIPLPGSELRERLKKENRLLPLEMVGWDRHDGLYLCYDPRPEGIDPYELEILPKVLMRKRYLGSAIDKKLNYGNWMNWAFNASIGFPIQFGTFYAKSFLHNLLQNRREKSVLEEDLKKENIFYHTLVHAVRGIKRKWRNLAVKTYGGAIVNRWFKEYRTSDRSSKLRQIFTRQKQYESKTF